MLEFRMLELEGRESRERTPELVRKVETGTETEDVVSLHSFLGDSGCSSQTSFDDLREVQRDFRNEKIGDTQAALQALMEQIPEPGGRALLLQTVALFETLLAKIQTLQKEGKTLEQERDQLTLALEAKKSVEAKLEATEAKLMSANEEVMNMIISMIITIMYQSGRGDVVKVVHGGEAVAGGEGGGGEERIDCSPGEKQI